MSRKHLQVGKRQKQKKGVRRVISMEMVMWAVTVTIVNIAISTTITVTAFKKMYSIYYDRTLDIYKKIEKLADACFKK